MSEPKSWRDGVRVVRGQSIEQVLGAPDQGGRATFFDFSGERVGRPWVGAAVVPPLAKTGTHTHGWHEVMIYVLAGTSEIRWGERLEYAAVIAPGDAAYFAPHVPHQEFNMDRAVPTRYLVVRSDIDRIVQKIDTPPVETPEVVY
jgi:uncharacterized RmlC-like cupin family protein